MSEQHSPAPWHLKEWFGPAYSVHDANDAEITDNYGISKADAALIAAAPDLLIQCKNALSYMEAYNQLTPTIGEYERNIANSLKIAIAKAEQTPQSVLPKTTE